MNEGAPAAGLRVAERHVADGLAGSVEFAEQGVGGQGHDTWERRGRLRR